MIIYTVNAVEEVKEKRTWKERLFSLPWRPFQKMKVVKKPSIFQVGGMMLVHPIFESRFKKELEDMNRALEFPILFENLIDENAERETVLISANENIYRHTFTFSNHYPTFEVPPFDINQV